MIRLMSKVHDLLTQKGKEEVLASGESRDVVEAAAAYMSAEDNQNGYLYSGWCQTALPHKRIPDGERWQVDHERLSLIVEPGFRMGPDREAIPVGVPYGSRARLILIYLQSEAIRT